jgi:hypothetical protein
MSQPFVERQFDCLERFIRGQTQRCQIFLGATYQNGGKIYQITTKYTKCPFNIPNGCKIETNRT